MRSSFFVTLALCAAATQAFLVMPAQRGSIQRSSNPVVMATRQFKENSFLGAMRDNMDSAENPHQVMISNLPFDSSPEELQAFASQAGQVLNVKIITDRETGRSKGYGFVMYSDALESTAAIERLNGQELGGRQVNVRPAIRKAPRAPYQPRGENNNYSTYN